MDMDQPTDRGKQMSQQFNVKSAILSEIAKTNDPAMKTVLLLMLGVLEEIGSKIDAAIDNEKKLMKSFVLNGHEDNHHLHHDWIAQRIAHQGRCEWANKQIAEQAESAATKKSMLSKLYENIINQMSTIIITGLAVAAGFTYLK